MRLKLEIVGGAILVALLCLVGYEQFQKALQVRVAEFVAQHDREADSKLNDQIKKLADADVQRQKDYEAKSAALQKLSPEQIVVRLPQYVPAAPAPVSLVSADSQIAKSGEAKAGDAIVPQADIKPIAQALLDGNKCSSDLAYCNANQQIWQDKYKLKSDESKQWETAAKGGPLWKRVAKDVGKIAIGVGVGYALHR